MKMNRLYWFQAIASEPIMMDEILKILSTTFTSDGIIILNTIIFTSDYNAKELADKLLKDKPKCLDYLLLDMTNSITENTFKAYLSTKNFNLATPLHKLISQFKPVEEGDKSTEEIINEILEQVAKLGEKSLTESQRNFLKQNS